MALTISFMKNGSAAKNEHLSYINRFYFQTEREVALNISKSEEE